MTKRRALEHENKRLIEDLRDLNAQLEQHVSDRTARLRVANEKLAALSRRLVHAQETERRRVAETLHDDIGQMLTALNLVLKRARRVSVAPELTEAELLVAGLLERVRELSVNLRPHVLDNLGLAVALRWHVKTFSRQTKISVLLRARRVPKKLAPDLAMTAFRLVQEALTNAARHSGARHAWVSIAGNKDGLQIEVRDDGRGFNPDHLPPDSTGLVNMRERVRLSGGEFSVASARNNGTTLRAALPVGGGL